MRNRIIVAVVCVPVFFIVLFYLPPYVLAALTSLICAISAYELLHTVVAKGNERANIYAVFSAAIIPVGAYFNVSGLVFPAVLLILMSFMFAEAITVYKKRRPIPFTQILITLFGGAVIPYMLSGLVSLKIMPQGQLFVLLPVISAFITDAGAYFTGVLFGKRKAFPLVSPKKTVEGCIGGLVIGTLAVTVYGMILVFTTMHEVRVWAFILLGFVGALMTELGDLAFSLIKREYEIKDYGRLLPGHGGMLDRFDSMVFTAPAMYLLLTVVPAITIWG